MKPYKRAVIMLIAVVTTFCGCKKEEERLYNELSEDIVYTDSFSPAEWEYPASRKHVKSGDNQIGGFISDDVIDPQLRAVLNVITQFIKINETDDKDKLADILSPAAYNSFILRNSELAITEAYTLRIQIPDSLKVKTFWLKFKILFQHISLIGQVELTADGDDKFVISDFDNQLFNQLKLYFLNM